MTAILCCISMLAAAQNTGENIAAGKKGKVKTMRLNTTGAAWGNYEFDRDGNLVRVWSGDNNYYIARKRSIMLRDRWWSNCPSPHALPQMGGGCFLQLIFL